MYTKILYPFSFICKNRVRETAFQYAAPNINLKFTNTKSDVYESFYLFYPWINYFANKVKFVKSWAVFLGQVISVKDSWYFVRLFVIHTNINRFSLESMQTNVKFKEELEN